MTGCQFGDHQDSTMTVTFRVFKKASSNNKVTIYLGRRDFVDHVTGSDPVDGVLNVDRENTFNNCS